ncbi:MAG: hypothetical protein IKQ48_00165 [Paludibacteraceae bacterium]|nr:hypothetical protein [Paludibacteraceae bacterium]
MVRLCFDSHAAEVLQFCVGMSSVCRRYVIGTSAAYGRHKVSTRSAQGQHKVGSMLCC